MHLQGDVLSDALMPTILLSLLVSSALLSFSFGLAKAVATLAVALVAGGLIACFEQGFPAYLMIVAFGAGFWGTACAFGLAAGVLLKTRSIAGVCGAIALLACVVYPLTILTYRNYVEKNEKTLFDSWVRSNAELTQLDSGQNTYDPRFTSQVVGYHDGSRYLFNLGPGPDHNSYHIAVDSFRSWRKSEFRIACIATNEEMKNGKQCDDAPRVSP